MKIFDWFYIRMAVLEGVLFGLEWDWYHKYCTVNLGIIRIVIDFDVYSPQLKHLGSR